jgi:hypothetical protein
VDVSVVSARFDALQYFFPISRVVARLQTIQSLLATLLQLHFERREPIRILDVFYFDCVSAHLHRRVQVGEFQKLTELATLNHNILAYFYRFVHRFQFILFDFVGAKMNFNLKTIM